MDTDRGVPINLYILKLKDSKLYVGQSINPYTRIKQHFKGKGSSWTKLHKPEEIIKVWDSGFTDWKEVEIEENRITLVLMSKFGWDNVRGGFWSAVNEDAHYKAIIHHRRVIQDLEFDLELLPNKSLKFEVISPETSQQNDFRE